MSKNVKATISFFRLLIEHSQRQYEPSPEHVLKRMLVPLCRSFKVIVEKGTKNDAWQVIEGCSRVCERLDRR